MLNQLKALSLRAAERPVTCVRYNKDGDLLFTAGQDGLVAVWSVKTGERLGTYHFIEDDPHNVDEKVLASQIAHKAVSCLDVTLDSRQLAVAWFDYIVFFEALTGCFLDSIHGPARFDCVEWNRKPGSQDSVVCCYSSKGGIKPATPAFKVYRTTDPMDVENKKGRKWVCNFDMTEFEGDPTCCAWGPYDESIIGATSGGKVYQWNMQGEVISQVSEHKDIISSVSFNGNRTIMLVTSKDSNSSLWEVPFMNGNMGLIFKYASDRPLSGGSISPLFDLDDKDKKRKPHMLLAGGQEAKDVTTTSAQMGQFETLIVNLVFGNEVGRLMAHYSPTTCVVFSPDGTSFATGAVEGNVKIHKFDESFMDHDHST
eukprot:Gregarina_sp_Poly_1__3658@NODE_2079_length_2722_cov_114_650471_g1341_i0_p1_GENE_NODE_2079_length_2722_cov_114_650471_g1341_i0NODE_2079_length_2722_cov_114_650471_g1341_i0_p1_ORF_typecomplete_len370_score45_45ANAPC4_WD40/PF12894_7/5_8e07ANAPC4_WD40/PF12894_7/0_17ANAPC4_WD40/PF12894_7/7_1e05ANAPC4_WD40/PF12894_7/1_9e05ANAPC4_WD40/PF12894_7/0_00094WD40/PF00400_32/1_6e05WD40/PF00400_32/31WD40/PF00400_32/28WD40/PF00400_32/39WD40/PF00400_32/0_00037Ge1_WD40/PF16529_5/0_055Ge1_WD40/PF16529_5/1_2Ge1_WD40